MICRGREEHEKEPNFVSWNHPTIISVQENFLYARCHKKFHRTGFHTCCPKELEKIEQHFPHATDKISKSWNLQTLQVLSVGPTWFLEDLLLPQNLVDVNPKICSILFAVRALVTTTWNKANGNPALVPLPNSFMFNSYPMGGCSKV